MKLVSPSIVFLNALLISGFLMLPGSLSIAGNHPGHNEPHDNEPHDNEPHDNEPHDNEPLLTSIPSVDVRYRGEAAEPHLPPDFQRHVAPLFGRLGCNGRACHGSFQGQGGFRLSLFGYDFSTDHQSLLEEGTLRVDLAAPDESLILTKPTNEDIHEGGLRYEVGSWQYNLLKEWIVAGAKPADRLHKLDRLIVEPREIRLSTNDQPVELQATAHWADGTIEDVTPLCRFQSNDESIALVSESGTVSTDQTPGDTHVVIFYDNAVVPIPVIHPHRGGDPSAEALSVFENGSSIDRLAAQKWKKLGLEPAELADDATFLRRVSIDITGTLPAPDEIREFLTDSNPDKRRQKIDQLLETPAYAGWWSTFLCDMTKNNNTQLRNISYNNNSPSQQWYDWIYDRLERNVPYDEMMAGIITATSRIPDEDYREYCSRMTSLEHDSSEFVNNESMPYYWMRREFQDRETQAISFAHVFLGLRIQCAQCHKHPFDQWSQQDFNEFSKFFSGVSTQNYNGGKSKQERQQFAQILQDLNIEGEQKNGGEKRRKLAAALKNGQTTPFGYLAVHPPKPSRSELQEYNKQVRVARKQKKKVKIDRPEITTATVLGGEPCDLTQYEDSRTPLMEWIRRPDNPYFAKAIVNRVWANYFGVGIVDPADDFNLANPASNSELLDYLATEFIQQGFDLKWLHREIANSRVYQLSWVTNETNQHDRKNFSRALPRRLPAEVVFDAVTSAASNTKINRSFRTLISDRAISVPGSVANNYGRKSAGTSSAFALKVFGRSDRMGSCDCDRSAETSLIQTVYLQNDADIHTMLTRKDGWINELTTGQPASQIRSKLVKQIASFEKRINSLEKSRNKNLNNPNQVKKLDSQLSSVRKRVQGLETRLQDNDSKIEQQIPHIVTQAYLRTLSRMPTTVELARCESYIRNDDDWINGVTGLLWALVNTKEFIVNH